MLTPTTRGNRGNRSAKATALIAPPDQTITLPLCTSCHERPRLATLTRCRSCLIADAQREREQREALQAKLAPATKACRTCKIGKPLGAFVAAKARGMTEIAKQTGLSRESLYKALSGEGHPQFDTNVEPAEDEEDKRAA